MRYQIFYSTNKVNDFMKFYDVIRVNERISFVYFKSVRDFIFVNFLKYFTSFAVE